jgi:hypothetical protein
MRSLAPLVLVALFGCDESKKDGGAASASASASAAAAPAASSSGPRPFSVMPDMFVDESGIGIGPERISMDKPDGESKVREAVERVPVDNKQMTVRTTKSAAFRDVALVIGALAKKGAPSILVKMDGGRKDLPAEIVIVPESRIDTADDCSVVATVLEDLSTAVWSFKAGLVAMKARKGLSGPDLTHTGDNIADAMKKCASKTAFFSASPKLKWEHAFHVGALVKKTDADNKVDKLVFLGEEPVAGRPVKLAK